MHPHYPFPDSSLVISLSVPVLLSGTVHTQGKGMTILWPQELWLSSRHSSMRGGLGDRSLGEGLLTLPTKAYSGSVFFESQMPGQAPRFYVPTDHRHRGLRFPGVSFPTGLQPFYRKGTEAACQSFLLV